MTGKAYTPEAYWRVMRLDELAKLPPEVQMARMQKKLEIEKRKGIYLAGELQAEIANLGDRAAARKLGLSVSAIQRLRRKVPYLKVEFRGKPRR
jgi:hypothetical protein